MRIYTLETGISTVVSRIRKRVPTGPPQSLVDGFVLIDIYRGVSTKEARSRWAGTVFMDV